MDVTNKNLYRTPEGFERKKKSHFLCAERTVKNSLKTTIYVYYIKTILSKTSKQLQLLITDMTSDKLYLFIFENIFLYSYLCIVVLFV